LLLVACDDDPSRPEVADLQADLQDVPDSLAPQGAIRVRFNRAITPNTALDPANFVVTDTCTGLRVPGTLRLDDASTIVFTPGTALPFLSVLAVRVQNILDDQGGQLEQPVTFARTVQGPPVGDVSWDFLSSPTSENLTGASFVDDNVGFLLANNGTVYHTTDGGQVFAAIFKDITITDAINIRAFGTDTLYMAAVQTLGGNPRPVILRSTNGGLGFQVVGTGATFGRYSAFSAQRAGATNDIVALAAGLDLDPAVRRYESSTGTFTLSTGLPPLVSPDGLIRVPLGVRLSRDTTAALVAVSLAQPSPFAFVRGEAYRSTNGGRSFTAITLPANTPALQGAGFQSATTGYLVGDSSAVLRVDVTTGAVTELGAAQGIPQTFSDQVTGTVTSYQFFSADFAPDGQNGWIVGQVTVDFPNVSDVIRGVILQTSDGGQTWTRQAILGAPDNGLNFAPVREIQARVPDFAVLAGDAGLVAARRGGQVRRAAACSFTTR
jgi:photosystem II stability/assembly factor-like uncharacterized protein